MESRKIKTTPIDKMALLGEVETFYNNTPVGGIVDADIILADIMSGQDFGFPGFATDIFGIWKSATDKECVEAMFYEFTGVEFDEYLERCKKETTKREGAEVDLD